MLKLHSPHRSLGELLHKKRWRSMYR